ncbi:hypothetical protein FOTG_04885 [Fusarium oxysporum f. sp. vasinfectum 25433]|uniref:Uncharacterized protein n=1 Tax=Fusarium oxysporum f. sp. vasinfectum 25433 TaxID=1089449 RepID=X0NAV8_FUSOX|nr:hypothetical protein FOTG_04885 [Fusarium oxysporum f. sp. vasinfectum 25433]
MRDSEPSNHAAHMPTLQPQKCMGALHGLCQLDVARRDETTSVRIRLRMRKKGY